MIEAAKILGLMDTVKNLSAIIRTNGKDATTEKIVSTVRSLGLIDAMKKISSYLTREE